MLLSSAIRFRRNLNPQKVMSCNTITAFQQNSETTFLPFLLIIITTLFTIKKLLFPAQKPNKNQPPSPPKLPIIGNLHQLSKSKHPHRILHTLSQKHGPIILLHLGNIPLLIVSSPESAKQILKTHDPIFSNRPNSTVASRIYDCKDIAFSRHGEYWRQVKGICVNELLSNRKVQSFRNVREAEVLVMVEKIKMLCGEGRLVNLSEIFVGFANDVICRVALGRKYSDGEGGRRFKVVLERLGVLLGSFVVGEFIPWLGWIDWVSGIGRKTREVAKDIDEFLEFVVSEHKDEKRRRREGSFEEENKKDFVDVLLDIQRNGMDGFVLDAIPVKALILDMFAAGTDTTFTLIEWTLSELITHEDVMLKLKKELKSAARSHKILTEDALEACKYLKSVIKETLRVHPPLPLLVPHESMQDIKLFGYDISAGTRVLVNVWAIGRDPSIWEDPDKFCPERFVNSCIDAKGHHFELVPFGAGRRGCPGAAFATGIVELAIANLVLNFEFALPGGMISKDLDMCEGDGITIHRKSPLCVVPSWDSTT